jgi:hypothetical protein
MNKKGLMESSLLGFIVSLKYFRRISCRNEKRSGKNK